MAAYLKFTTKTGAEKRSKSLWAEAVGGVVNESYGTQLMYGVVVSEKVTGGSYLIVSDDGDGLTAQEKGKLHAEEKFETWRGKYQPSLAGGDV